MRWCRWLGRLLCAAVLTPIHSWGIGDSSETWTPGSCWHDLTRLLWLPPLSRAQLPGAVQPGD